MKILVINSGSSSVKFSLINPKTKNELFNGYIDGIGLTICKIITEIDNKKIIENSKIPDHDAAIKKAIEILLHSKIIKDKTEITAIGHRVVHGGYKFNKTTKITTSVIKTIKDFCFLAPLHNPSNLKGIEICKKLFPKTPQVAVFDTAFHASIDNTYSLYPLPKKYVQKYHYKKYGFHGTSYKYIVSEVKHLLKHLPKRLIVCHMGNGISVAAIEDGKSIDTSLGYSTIEGIPMSTRCGSIDPGIIPLLMQNEKLSANKMEMILHKESGLKAICGHKDMRIIRKKALAGDKDSQKAIDYLCYKLTFYIGAYAGLLKGLDCLVFTGGMGEQAHYIRKKIVENFAHLGAKLDLKKNIKNKDTIISTARSKVKILKMRTDEDLQIAKETASML